MWQNGFAYKNSVVRFLPIRLASISSCRLEKSNRGREVERRCRKQEGKNIMCFSIVFIAVLGHNPPGHVPPGHLPPDIYPPGHLPSGHIPPWTLTPWTLTPWTDTS